jgi:HSP20 family molecular chaperone IbpA
VLIKKDEISASLVDGMLIINLPKAEEAKPKKIMIQA